MRSLLALLSAASLCVATLACKDDDDAVAGTAGTGGSSGGSGGQAGSTAVLEPCLERPTDLPRPPRQGLPCELLPPGFSR